VCVCVCVCVCAVYVIPEVGALATLVYKLTGKCLDHMKSEKLSELQPIMCPAAEPSSKLKKTSRCRYQMHAVCDQIDANVSEIITFTAI